LWFQFVPGPDSLGGLKIRFLLSPALVALALLAAAACSKAPFGSAEAVQPHHHHHHPPHGGTAVVLGDEEYHVELVLDESTGALQAYVLDSEMENFVRAAAPRVEIDATLGGTHHTLVLQPVANPETGETVGDTSLFEASADWLKAAKEFDGVLKAIEIRGATFSDVRFNFPKGNDTEGR
jgi:hypothetical protein